MVETTQTSGLWPSLYEPFRKMGARVSEWLAPASEASEGNGGYRITMELPGVAESDIDVSVHDGVVTVKGEKTESKEETGDNFFFSERQYGAFSRSFRLPADASEDDVAATLKDGVLTVNVKRLEAPSQGAKKVNISKG